MTHKKKCRALTRAHDPFFDILKIWPTFIYRGEVPSNTFAKLPVHALINDPKKMFLKKLYVTIPQWFQTFPNMSDLWPGRNRAKCGLQLNDPIDWLKLRLSQPKNRNNYFAMNCTLMGNVKSFISKFPRMFLILTELTMLMMSFVRCITLLMSRPLFTYWRAKRTRN